MKADFGITRSELAMLIDEWIFSERDRAIVKRRLLDGIRFDSLEEEFDLSARQIKNIVYRSERSLRDHLPR